MNGQEALTEIIINHDDNALRMATERNYNRKRNRCENMESNNDRRKRRKLNPSEFEQDINININNSSKKKKKNRKTQTEIIQMNDKERKEYYQNLNTRTSLLFLLYALTNWSYYKKSDNNPDGGEYISMNKTCKKPVKLLLMDPQQTLATYLFSKIVEVKNEIRLYIHNDIDCEQMCAQYVNSAHTCISELSEFEGIPKEYHIVTFSSNGDTGNNINCCYNENQNKNNRRYYGLVAFKYQINNNNNNDTDIDSLSGVFSADGENELTPTIDLENNNYTSVDPNDPSMGLLDFDINS